MHKFTIPGSVLHNYLKDTLSQFVIKRYYIDHAKVRDILNKKAKAIKSLLLPGAVYIL